MNQWKSAENYSPAKSAKNPRETCTRQASILSESNYTLPLLQFSPSGFVYCNNIALVHLRLSLIRIFKYSCFLISGLLLLAGCSTTRNLSSDEYLLTDNNIIITDGAKISKENVSNILKQQPIRKVLGVLPIYLWAYNVPDPAKFAEKNTKRRARNAEKNEKRLEKGKPAKPYRPYGSWWRETVGEPPAILDSSRISRSVDQVRLYLLKHGWFDATVYATVNYKKQKAEVNYFIKGNTPYFIDTIKMNISDGRLLTLTYHARREQTNVKSGDQFNIDRLDKERDYLTGYFRNRGYYTFSPELIYFQVDSTLPGNIVNLTLGIVPNKTPWPGNPDSLIVVPYQRYAVDNILVSSRDPNGSSVAGDTILYNHYLFNTGSDFKVKPRILSQHILFKPNQYYTQDRVTQTYKRLSALPAVRAVNIGFTPLELNTDSAKSLSCTILLTPAPKHNITLETNGTNRGGFLGISGNIGYTNRNIFQGSEMLRISLAGGIEAQRLLTDQADNGGENLSDDLSLNTIEFGPEISLTFPKFLLPVNAAKFAKSSDPKTTLTTNLSYQRRPDYERTRSFFSLAYKWSQSSQKHWVVSPAELSLISINKSAAFQQRLDEIGDLYLLNSYQDHFIMGSAVSFIYTNQALAGRQNVFYYRGDLESAGFLLRQAYEWADKPLQDDGSYHILDIPFAQYIRTKQDFRFYRIHNQRMSTAYRFIGGIGLPQENLSVLPFEKSFFAGGANDIRAWQARTLGPGSYTELTKSYDKIGDILLEANVEYRFDLINILEGALFLDAGNIWTLEPQTTRPGAAFEFKDFLSEVAIGGGAGARFNFGYFLIRLDVGLQLKDPAMEPGERWIFQPKEAYNEKIDQLNEERLPVNQLSHYRWRWNFNLGIGYPF